MKKGLMALVGASAAVMFFASGCGSEGSATDAAADASGGVETAAAGTSERTADASVELVASNESCPKTGRPVSAAIETIAFEGEQIGFCCGGCKSSFERMSDAERTELLRDPS
ncbi:MAG: hypothetical protein AAFN41_05245 [Planctomycetota bacterium]